MNLRLAIYLLLFLLLRGIAVKAQSIDSLFRKRYLQNNVIELYPGIYSTQYRFVTPRQPAKNFRMQANSSAYAGIFVKYKWLSVSYSTAMPDTHLDNNIKLRYTSLRFSFGIRGMFFNPYYYSYDGLLIAHHHHEGFEVFRNMRVMASGLDFYYYTNTNHFSFRTGNSFTENQVHSAGSFYVVANPQWQKMTWRNPSQSLIMDSLTYKILSGNPEWISVLISPGYAYNISLNAGHWLITPAAAIGGGIVKEINRRDAGLQPALRMQGRINAGYSTDKFYFFMHGQWENLQTNLLIKNMHQVNSRISFTVGYRFKSLKNKILGVL